MKLADLYVPSSPKYLALADAVERGVAGGLLAPGEALPTQRELAGALGVTVGTVTRAYAETARRGLTVGITGRGTFIAEARPDVDILTEDAVLGGPDLPGPADGAAGRGGTVDDIVPMIQFLADKKKSSFIVGQTIFIDGGQSIDGVIDCMLEDEI